MTIFLPCNRYNLNIFVYYLLFETYTSRNFFTFRPSLVCAASQRALTKLSWSSIHIQNRQPAEIRLPAEFFVHLATETIQTREILVMKFRLAAFAALLSPLLSDASFLRDVARASNKKKLVENALMAKAVPLDQYRQGLRDQGYDISTSYRGLEEGDDYFMDANNMYSFSGYSMKYAECQPVQKFSEDAISAGEYTPMVLDDIVILRLCPSSSCSSSDSYGCYNNFAEYAISVGDYIRVMLRYKMDQEEQLCEWCNECIGRRRLDGEDNNNQDQGQNDGQQDGGDQDQADQGNQDQDGNNNGQDQDQQDQGNDNQQQQQQQDNDENDGNQQNNDDEQQADEGNDDQQNDDGNENQAVGDDYWSNNYQGDYGYYQGNGGCDDYETYCYDESGYAVCDEDAGDDSYLDAEGYLNYMDCVNVDGYYIRPRCDGYDKSISMGVFYDPFCSQYAGDNINMNNLGLGIETDFFEEFYDDVECMECSQSVSKRRNDDA